MIKYFGLFITILASCLWSSDGCLHAQVKKATAQVKGTVVSIEKAKTGRNYLLKVKTDDDTEYDVPLTSRTKVTVTAKTDHEIVKAGMIVEDPKVVDAGGELISAQLTLLIAVPFSPQLQQLPEKSNGEDVFHVVGQVLNVAPQPDCVKGGRIIEVDCGSRTIQVFYPTDMSFTIKTSDPALIKQGDSIEIDGTVVESRKQITAKTVSVTSSEPIPSEDYFSKIKDAKKNKSTKSSTKSKTSPKGAPKDGEADEKVNGAGKETSDMPKNKKGSN